MKLKKQNCSNLAVKCPHFTFDDADCNIDEEVLSEGVKVQTPIWSERMLNNMKNFHSRIREKSINLRTGVLEKRQLGRNLASYSEERKGNTDIQSLNRFEDSNSTSKVKQEKVDELNSKSDSSSSSTLKSEIRFMLRTLAQKRTESIKESSFCRINKKEKEVKIRDIKLSRHENRSDCADNFIPLFSINYARNVDDVTMNQISPNIEIGNLI